MPVPESRPSYQATPSDPTTIRLSTDTSPAALGSAQSDSSVATAPDENRTVATIESGSPSPVTPVRLASA